MQPLLFSVWDVVENFGLANKSGLLAAAVIAVLFPK